MVFPDFDGPKINKCLDLLYFQVLIESSKFSLFTNVSKGTPTGIYSSILFELESFYTSEINETTTYKIGIAAEIKTLLGIGSFKVSPKIESTNDNSNKMNPIAAPQLEANVLIKFLKPSGKIIVIEDFHYVQEDLKEKISQDLKAFSDEMCPWIIVGVVQHKSSKLLSYNVDLQLRIS